MPSAHSTRVRAPSTDRTTRSSKGEPSHVAAAPLPEIDVADEALDWPEQDDDESGDADVRSLWDAAHADSDSFN